MGNTLDEGNPFVDWLRRQLFDRKMTVADLARVIVRNEGTRENDADDFARRTKAVHGLISNVMNRVAALGVKTAQKVADALEVPQEEVMEMAGLLVRSKTRANEGSAFVDWLYDKLAEKKWRISDLTRRIAELEGFGSDSNDFERRSRSIHGNISNIVNGKRALGASYARKIADALEVSQETVMVIAGLLVRDNRRPTEPTDLTSKAQAEIEALSEDEIKLVRDFMKLLRRKRTRND